LAGESNGVFSFFKDQQGTPRNSLGITNMRSAGQIENGRVFDVQQIAIKALRRKAAAETDEWTSQLLSTLFAYGTLVFHIDGTDRLGEFPLCELVPTIADGASIKQASQIAPAVIDLKEYNLLLSELTNFWVDIRIDVPNEGWNATTKAWENIASAADTSPVKGMFTALPDDLVLKVELRGEELFSQL
jgi:hypothetical protein